MRRARLTAVVLLATLVTLQPSTVGAHDASAWGGLFRTRDGGKSWFQASSGKVMGGALALAIDPRDDDRIVLGTDSGLLGTRNGGRDWDVLAPDVLLGPVLAVAIDAQGQTMLAATASTLAVSQDGFTWRSLPMPIGAAPPRALVPDERAGIFYLLGWNSIFRSDDAGASWVPLRAQAPAAATQLLVDANGDLLAVASASLWRGRDGGSSWFVVSPSQVESVARDPRNAQTLWAGANNQVFRSDDAGRSWTALGRPLPESDTRFREVAPELNDDANQLLVSTDRGLYVTRNAGATWDLLVDNLPGHIEAGPLAVDGRQPAMLYAGFSVTPYDEVWQNAASGNSSLARLGRGELAGAGALLTLIAVCAGIALRALAR